MGKFVRTVKRVPRFVVITLIRLYQVVASPFPSPCRYTPSCSSYAREAVERYGALRGTWLALKRLLRCNPLGSSGYDPVP